MPVVLLSARAGEESRLEGLKAGADDYLVKPFSARELLARVEAHLELARVRRAAARRESELRTEVRHAHEQAAAILESITDGSIALDRDWCFTHVNAEAERINGIRRENQIGKSQWELFPATRGTLLEREWRRAVAEHVAVEFDNYYAPSDSWFHIKGYPSTDGGLAVFFHDITPRKRSEEALLKAHSELEQRVLDRTRELTEANARLARQVAKRKRVELARTELLRRLERSQEDEHRRIARELHDHLTQELAMVAIEAGIIKQSPGCPREIGQMAHAMYERLAALSESVHSLSRQLHPSILDDLGLVDALRSECSSLNQRDGIQVIFRAHDVPRDLPSELALCVYRVAQESLRNIARHAGCSRATVRLVAAPRAGAVRARPRDRFRACGARQDRARPGEHAGTCAAHPGATRDSFPSGEGHEGHFARSARGILAMNKPRILLADDHLVLAEGLRVLLEPHFDIVGIVSDGRDLLAAVNTLDPDVVVLDISMSAQNGIDAARELRRQTRGRRWSFSRCTERRPTPSARSTPVLRASSSRTRRHRSWSRQFTRL